MNRFFYTYNKYQYNVRFREIPILLRNTETVLSGTALRGAAFSGAALSGVLLYMLRVFDFEKLLSVDYLDSKC